MAISRHNIFWFKVAVFIACLVPLAWLAYDAFTHQLGANPVEKITHRTGEWALRVLWITLAITPLRRLTGWGGLLRVRRMLGLFAFFYALLHFTTWLVFDHFFDWREMVKDILKRPYITIGFTAFVLLIPLALTSTDAMMRRLGKRWKQLHQLIYPIALLSVAHYLWLVKRDLREPLVYAGILAILLWARWWWKRPRPGVKEVGATR